MPADYEAERARVSASEDRTGWIRFTFECEMSQTLFLVQN